MHPSKLLTTFKYQILRLYSIEPLIVNGTSTQKARADELQRFCCCTNSEVLLLSNVGIVRLNLGCANILVIMVSIYMHRTYSLANNFLLRIFVGLGKMMPSWWVACNDTLNKNKFMYIDYVATILQISSFI